MATVITDVFLTVLQLKGLEQYQSGIRRAAGSWGEMEGRMGRLERVQRGATVGAAAFGTVLAAALNQAAKFEQTEIGFKTMLGSAGAAQKKLKELQEFAEQSPFNFQQTAGIAQRMLAAGVPAERLMETMRALGNATAAAGGGQEEFARAGRALGQMMTNQILQREEINQLTETGIPAARIFQEELGLTAEQMRDIGREGITADRAIEAFNRGVSRRWPRAMEEQSKTLMGRISTMEDSTQKIGRNLAETWVPALADAVRHATVLADKFNKLSGTQKEWVSKGAVGAVGALAGTAVLAATIRNVATVGGAVKGLLFGGAAAAGAAGGGAGAAAGGAAAAVAGGGLIGLLKNAELRGAMKAAGRGVAGAMKWGGMATKLGTGIGIPLAFLSLMMGNKSNLGKGVDTAAGAFGGLMIGSRFGPAGALLGTLAGAGLGAWGAGVFDGKGGKGQEKQGKPPVIALLERIANATEQQAANLKHKDLHAGVGSDDVIDVMGEARVLRLLAGKMAR